MNRRILAIVVSGAVALPMAALAQDEEVKVPQHSHPGAYEHEHEMAGEDGAMMMVPAHAHQYDVHPAGEHGHDELHGHSATVYGTLRYGATMFAGDPDASFDLGSAHGSRFGIKGSVEAGANLTAGFQLERALNAGLTPRHHNVSLSGPFGTFTLGQSGSPYYSATTWDGSAHLGGGTDAVLRRQGIKFESALGGPFDFAVLIADDNSQDGDNGATPAAPATFTPANASLESGDGADILEVSGSLTTGPVALNVGYREMPTYGGGRLGGTVGGSVASFDWEVGYDAGTDVDNCAATGATVAVPCDSSRYGFQLTYVLSAGPGGGQVWTQYGNVDSDQDMNDSDYWVFGYSHFLSEAVTQT